MVYINLLHDSRRGKHPITVCCVPLFVSVSLSVHLEIVRFLCLKAINWLKHNNMEEGFSQIYKLVTFSI